QGREAKHCDHYGAVVDLHSERPAAVSRQPSRAGVGFRNRCAMSDEESATLKIGSWISIALGPLLSRTIPMAADLRQWAFWFSGVVSLAAILWLSVRLSDAMSKRLSRWVFLIFYFR